MLRKNVVVHGLFFLIITFCLMSAPLRAEDLSRPGDSFRVLDVGERSYEDGPAIAVILSHPLDSKVRHDEHLRISDEEELLKSAWVLSEDRRVLFFPHVEPETTYSVVVMESLTSEDGKTLGKRAIKSVKTRKVTPGVNFAGNGLLLPEKVAQGLPVATVNVPSVEIEFFRVNNKGLRHFVRWQGTNARQDYDEISRVKKYGKFVYSGRFDLEPPRNRRVIRHIPVMDIEALQKPGMYFAVMRQPGEYDYSYQATFFLVTDIGIHARVYRNQALLVTSSLKTGKPLADVELTFFNQRINPIGHGKTDEKGRFVFSGSLQQKKTAFVKAAMGDHISVLPLNYPALDLSEFRTYYRPQKPREIFVYSPRDLYRPGETVVLSALLRDYDGRPTKSLPLTASVYRPDGRKIRGFTWRPESVNDGAVNYYQTQIQLPSSAQTGRWRLELKDDPASKQAARVYRFQVEDFMPERMKLDLESTQDHLDTTSDWKVDVTGAYLYGAPAAGNRLETQVQVRAKRDLLPEYPGFEFGNIDDKNYRDSWDRPDQKLDDKGKALVTVENHWRKLTSPVYVRLYTSLYETGGRPVSRSIDTPVWPANELVGLRALFDGDNTEEGLVEFDIVRVKPDGSPAPASGLMVKVIKEERDYYWEYSEFNGWQRKYTEKNYDYLTDTLTYKGDKPARYGLQLRYGRYVLAVTDPKTNLTTSHRFYVGSYWYDRQDRRAARPDRVQLDLDKASYRPGDTIRLTITPPHSGNAAVMVEGRSLLWFHRTPVSAKGTTIEIPVQAHWDAHNIYISTVVFRPGDAEEKITPNRAIGLVHLPLDRSDRKLEVKLDAPEKLTTKGDTDLAVKLKLDKPAEGEVFVTLAAVDVGILNITSFRTPNPFAWFFEPRRYNVDQRDLYGKVIEIMDGKMARLRYGGDADMAPGGKRPETKVKLLSLFQGPVKFSETGEAEIKMTMPGDFNGRIRLMAVAFSGDSFGNTDREVTVAAPVVTQLATPRFLAPGDECEFTMDVHNLSGGPRELNLTLTATAPLTLENGQRKLSLKDNEKVTLKFPVMAQKAFGASIIKMDLTSEDLHLKADWQLGVRPGYPGLTRQVRKVLRQGDTLKLDPDLVSDLMPSSVSADMKISSTIPINTREIVNGLLTYPYGCLEQTTSRAYPLLYATGDVIDRYRLTFINHKERIQRLNGAIERIGLMQGPKGGFGLWNQRSPEEYWLTGYAMDFLVQARDIGLNVSDLTLDRGFKRLDYYLQRKWPKKDPDVAHQHYEMAIRSYAAFVLAKVGRAPLGTLRTLFDNHKQEAASSLPLTHLGLALKIMGDERRGSEALGLATAKKRAGRQYWGDYGSPLRDAALTLALLIEHAPETDGLEDMMLYLDDIMRTRQWLSTQEKYAVFKLGMVLDKNRNKNRQWKGALALGDDSKALDQREDFILTPSVEEIQSGIGFTSETDGLLYLSAIIGGYSNDPPEKDDSIVAIERNYYEINGDRLKTSRLEVGDLLVVNLRLESKMSIPDALVVDLLPAGLEIENPNFKNSVKLDDTDLERLEIEEQEIWRLKRNTRIVHEEYRDDRFVAAMKLSAGRTAHLFYLVRVVSPGIYTVPPPFVESMYRPELRGIGNTSPRLEIMNGE